MQTENPYKPPQVDDRKERGLITPAERLTIIFMWVLAFLFFLAIASFVTYIAL